jgi:hypothetical protein
MSLRHQIVQFRLADIYFPEPAKVAMQLHNQDQIQGEVVDLSDSGANKDAYAVIEVKGLTQPLLVPVNRINAVSNA